MPRFMPAPKHGAWSLPSGLDSAMRWPTIGAKLPVPLNTKPSTSQLSVAAGAQPVIGTLIVDDAVIGCQSASASVPRLTPGRAGTQGSPPAAAAVFDHT